MKLHKTRCPLGANPTPAGRVFRLLRISRKGWACPAGTPYTGARSRGREVLANCIPTGFTWGQNTAQSTYGQTSQGQAPLPKQSPSGIRPLAPTPKEAGSWNSTTQPHSLSGRDSFPAQVDRQRICGPKDSDVTPTPKSDNSVSTYNRVPLKCQVLYCVDKQTRRVSS